MAFDLNAETSCGKGKPGTLASKNKFSITPQLVKNPKNTIMKKT
jgi:hypothetical protein